MECEKCEREQGSGENMSDVSDKAIAMYTSLYGDFKHYQSWLLLKEKQKFQGGILPLSYAAKRAEHTFVGDYMSSDIGATPMDLNHPLYEDKSSDTPMSSHRPSSVKASKGKAKATSSHSAPRPRHRLQDMPTRSRWPPLTLGCCWTHTTLSGRRTTQLKSNTSRI